MEKIILVLFGHGTELNCLQMCMRAFVMFFIALIIIRISGQRSFGSKSAFDNIVAIMLGAVLSRAVVGASPFIPTVLSGLVIAVIHRGLAVASLSSDTLSNVVKGKSLSLFKTGIYNTKNMRQSTITEGDIIEGIRLKTNMNNLDLVEEVFIERTGELSVVKTTT